MKQENENHVVPSIDLNKFETKTKKKKVKFVL